MSRNAKWGHTPTKRGVSKGGVKPPFGTQPLEQRCNVLYLLARLAGKMWVSHDGHTHFERQENGRDFANGNEQKPVRFHKRRRVCNTAATFVRIWLAILFGDYYHNFKCFRIDIVCKSNNINPFGSWIYCHGC